MFVKRRRPQKIPKESPPPPEDVRRLPRQDRSRERARRILDAAATLFTEHGYEATTTEAIAAKADTSIGSIYQFYPNKRAIFDAIAARYFGETRELFDALEATYRQSAPLEELLGNTVYAFMALQKNASFQAIWKNWLASPEIFTTVDAVNRDLAKRTEAILALRAKGVPPRRRLLVARMIIEVMGAILRVSATHPEDAKEIAEEAKTLLVRYLLPYESRPA
jgi:AcrR family transcriptional regulator